MGKTLRNYKGQVHRQAKEKKHVDDKKFFGHTDGQHSKGTYVRIETADNSVRYVKTDRAPIKNVDFKKYGWPLDLRGKPMRVS